VLGAQPDAGGQAPGAQRDMGAGGFTPGSAQTPGTTPADAAPDYGNVGSAGPAGAPGIPPTAQSPGLAGSDQPPLGASGAPNAGGAIELGPPTAGASSGAQDATGTPETGGHAGVPDADTSGVVGTGGPTADDRSGLAGSPARDMPDYGTTIGPTTPAQEQSPASGAGRTGTADPPHGAANRGLQGDHQGDQNDLSGPPRPPNPTQWDPDRQDVDNP
jgi:hypothetical protein